MTALRFRDAVERIAWSNAFDAALYDTESRTVDVLTNDAIEIADSKVVAMRERSKPVTGADELADLEKRIAELERMQRFFLVSVEATRHLLNVQTRGHVQMTLGDALNGGYLLFDTLAKS